MELNLVEVDVDLDGISSARLTEILEKWHESADTKHLPFPRTLYTMSALYTSGSTSAGAETRPQPDRIEPDRLHGPDGPSSRDPRALSPL